MLHEKKEYIYMKNAHCTIAQVHYVCGVSRSMMDKIRAKTNSWAEGNDNICLTAEEALTIDELKLLLPAGPIGDVIISR